MDRPRRRGRRYVWAGLAALLVLAYLVNASWLARPHAARPTLLAHRGVHQTFACKELRNDTCTAACIDTPSHDYLENTIRSMRAAFDLGAEVVELDVHSTSDGELAVFHDERLECRTNGSGVTHERSMAYLRSLDLGHGYTADGGKTFPFRGRAVGLVPTLTEVLDTFPERRFLIHIKSNDPSEADLLARALQRRPSAQRERLMVYGGGRPVERLLTLMPDLRGLTRTSVRACLGRYALVGWTGRVPRACRSTFLLVPKNYAPYLWGWPHRFLARMRSVGTDVFLVGANQGGDWLAGIDSLEDVRALAPDYDGGVWTDRIERVGPLLAPRNAER